MKHDRSNWRKMLVTVVALLFGLGYVVSSIFLLVFVVREMLVEPSWDLLFTPAYIIGLYWIGAGILKRVGIEPKDLARRILDCSDGSPPKDQKENEAHL